MIKYRSWFEIDNLIILLLTKKKALAKSHVLCELIYLKLYILMTVSLQSCSLNACFIFFLAPAQARKTRAELMKDIDADYYGYRDEDDGVLMPLEQKEQIKGV